MLVWISDRNYRAVDLRECREGDATASPRAASQINMGQHPGGKARESTISNAELPQAPVRYGRSSRHAVREIKAGRS